MNIIAHPLGDSSGSSLVVVRVIVVVVVVVVVNSGFSKLRMEHFLRIDFHMKLLLGGAQTFHRLNCLAVLEITISIFAVCTYACEYV